MLGWTQLVVFAEYQWSQPAGGGRSLGHKGIEGPGLQPDASLLPELVSHLGQPSEVQERISTWKGRWSR